MKKWLVFAGAGCILGYVILNPSQLLKRAPYTTESTAIYHLAANQQVIALTIDDGPHPTITPLILDLLRENQAKATFFLTGENIQQHPEIVQRIIDEGHEIGNHMLDHNFSLLLDACGIDHQISQTHEFIAEYQTNTMWLRPGGGLYNRKILSIAKSHEYKIALGSIYPYDALIPEEYGGSRFINNFIERIYTMVELLFCMMEG